MVKSELRVTRDLNLETSLLINSRSSSDDGHHATDLSEHGDDMQSTPHDDENREYSKTHLSWRIVAAIGIASLTSALMGYDEGIMSGAVITLQASLALTNFETDVMMGCLNFCSTFGTLGASYISDAYGRKSGLYATTVLLIVGPLLMCSAYTYTQLMIGRIATVFGCGFAIAVAPLYAAELAPATLRGSLVALAETSINFGVFMGYVVAYMLARLPNDYDWRLMVEAI
ncbi:hypothetical protein SARC_02345 [Sphaeroforma arctica JP610]|uniref:Major facilitator superfamily (MFS) profile domain-containing protein n=1 Tax=Sphaeroforma arctica JP610 TaxID=667725 RepID=A0A0L0G8Z7_9EUKA|nr:hypothetical protein SARC_02345 [Sphaeroforma arctica JP610]KNC85475.1 hypothetical protein SARC_02345 [Sphaeroforma arctica JP610]|eukprot:XP_014159377.1 hypothetical protein SARC_02345 [Sphaeroforma arctica JP610]